MKAVFLSASVPDPSKPHFVGPSDVTDIVAAVKALVFVVLGRRPLIWGGHPAITPMIWTVASSLDVDYSKWVTLYQSEYFEDQYPEDNARFKNTRYVPAAEMHPNETEEQRRADSLKEMRRRMFSSHDFESAVFIGGMQGIVDEFELIGRLCPEARRIPVLSTGGATGLLADRLDCGNLDLDRLANDIDYIPLLYEFCRVNPSEPRRSIR
ncbi:MAG: hypothetical protein OXF56_14600 [Rhodobacteraceae bacterium]|nr:hypothetical protein [Paracoccaceae bacterium]